MEGVLNKVLHHVIKNFLKYSVTSFVTNQTFIITVGSFFKNKGMNFSSSV